MYDLQLSLALDPAFPGRDGAWVYAPTMRAPGGACIEMAQVYQRLSGEDTTGKFFGLWDWCESPPHGSWAVFESVDETFINRYVRPYQSRNTYAVTLVTPNTGHTSGQCWSANIYNYEVGGWVERLQSCGTPYPGAGAVGWTMWQSWYVTQARQCPTLPSIRALDIALADPGSSTFDPFTNHPADYSSWGPRGGCWKSEIYTFESPVPGLADNTWRANTPDP